MYVRSVTLRSRSQPQAVRRKLATHGGLLHPIQTFDVFEHTASAKVVLENGKQRFETFYLFVREGDTWQLITDMPVLEPIER